MNALNNKLIETDVGSCLTFTYPTYFNFASQLNEVCKRHD